MKDFLIRSDSNWRLVFLSGIIGHTFIKEKSACFQEASVRIWRNDSLIHHRRREDQDRTWRSLSWTNWIDEEDLLCQLSENHCSSLRKFPFYNFPLKMPPTVSVHVIKVKHGGRPYPILKKFREIVIQKFSNMNKKLWRILCKAKSIEITWNQLQNLAHSVKKWKIYCHPKKFVKSTLIFFL